MPIKGGFNPTGFCFPPCTDCFEIKKYDHNLCRSCYSQFWKEFGQIRDQFVSDFFKNEEDGLKISEYLSKRRKEVRFNTYTFEQIILWIKDYFEEKRNRVAKNDNEVK